MCSVGEELCGLSSRSVVMVMPSLGLAAPIAACEAITRRQAGWGRTASGRSASGGRRAAAILFRDAKPEAYAACRVGRPAAENSRRPPLRPRPACRQIALSQAAGAAFRREGFTTIRCDTRHAHLAVPVSDAMNGRRPPGEIAHAALPEVQRRRAGAG